MSDLIERLRDPKTEGACWCCQEAADALEQKNAEIKRRKKDVRTQYNRAEANLKYAKQLEAALLDIPPEPAGEYYTGLHCGIEDRDIYDRYEAANYGWESAFEYVLSVVNPLFAGDTGQDDS